MTSVLLFLDHRPMMAASIVDAPNVTGIVNNPATRHLQRLDGQIDITDTIPFACGGYADIYPGILRGDRNIAVRTVHVYGVPPPDSRTTSCIKVAVKVFRDVHDGAQTSVAQQKYAKASQ